MAKKLARLGIVLVVSGPSGAGKSTICNRVLRETSNLRFSVSCTTRAPRAGEKNGRDYHFISKDEFESHIQRGAFLEFAQVHGQYYGTLRSEVDQHIRAGQDVLLDIDIQGVAQIQKKKNDAIWARCAQYVFISPPSREELERRLRGRGTEEEAKIRSRLNTSLTEMTHWKNYDYLLVNVDIDDSIQKMKNIIQTQRLRTSLLTGSTPWDS